MHMKGISPMIAIVLLIAFTVAVGGLISVFLSSFTTTTTGAVETAATNQTKCAGSYIDVDTTSSAVILKSRGTQTITSINCFWGNGTQLNLTNAGTLYVDTLGAGAMNASSNGRGSATLVTCLGNCLNVGVSGECKTGQVCWK